MDALLNIFTTIVLAVSSLFAVPVSDQETVATDTVSATSTATVVQIIDGDTVVVDIDGKREFVRYTGIDTPEYGEDIPECYAKEATAANRVFVADQTVTLVADKENRDKYNRLLRYVYVDEIFVNAELVKDGFARATYYYPNDAHRTELSALEAIAQKSGAGLWNNCSTESIENWKRQ